ncbi:MAG: hypothetical protein RL095_3269 [Verrucomicrobiota bacterium]|jgi:glycosyltransferase involved in cell wall biosynthesis
MPPRFAVVIPAFNEERWLSATLNSVIAARDASGVAGEIIVVDNNSSDATRRVALAFPGVRLVFEPLNQISRARNAGAAAAEAEWLLFLDADTLLPPQTLAAALAELGRGDFCGGAATVAYADPEVAGIFGRGLLRCWNAAAHFRRLSAGAFIFCHRADWARCGGFSKAVFAGEDVLFGQALSRLGKPRGARFVVLQEAVLTSARKLQWFGIWGCVKQILICFLPGALFSRRLLYLWYSRPEGR